MDQKRAKEAMTVFQQVQQNKKPSPALLKQVGNSALWMKGFAQTQPTQVNAAVKKAVSQGSFSPKQKLDLDNLAKAKNSCAPRPWRTWQGRPTGCTGPRNPHHPAAAASGQFFGWS